MLCGIAEMEVSRKMKMLISIEPPCGLSDFYDIVAKGLVHFDTREKKYDCTKINVAQIFKTAFMSIIPC